MTRIFSFRFKSQAPPSSANTRQLHMNTCPEPSGTPWPNRGKLTGTYLLGHALPSLANTRATGLERDPASPRVTPRRELPRRRVVCNRLAAPPVLTPKVRERQGKRRGGVRARTCPEACGQELELGLEREPGVPRSPRSHRRARARTWRWSCRPRARGVSAPTVSTYVPLGRPQARGRVTRRPAAGASRRPRTRGSSAGASGGGFSLGTRTRTRRPSAGAER